MQGGVTLLCGAVVWCDVDEKCKGYDIGRCLGLVFLAFDDVMQSREVIYYYRL